MNFCNQMSSGLPDFFVCIWLERWYELMPPRLRQVVVVLDRFWLNGVAWLPDGPIYRQLQVDDCRVIVDDGLVGGADVVAVLEDAAQHEPGNAIDAQMQGCLGKGPQDTRDGLVGNAVHTVDEVINDLLVVADCALIAFGKGNVGLGDGLLQMLEQQVGDSLRGIG